MTDEFLDVVDENNNVKGFTKLKSQVHIDGDWHRGAHLWVLIGDKILLQKRASNKDILPNRFDVACAGHVKSGEDYEGTIVREAMEELGIHVNHKDLIFLEERKQETIDDVKGLKSREINKIFVLKFHGKIDDFNIDKEEVSCLKIFDLDKLKKQLNEYPDLFVDDIQYFQETIEKIEKLLKK